MRLANNEYPYVLGTIGGGMNQMGGGQTGYFNNSYLDAEGLRPQKQERDERPNEKRGET